MRILHTASQMKQAQIRSSLEMASWLHVLRLICLLFTLGQVTIVYAAHSFEFSTCRSNFSEIYFDNITLHVHNGSLYSDIFLKRRVEHGLRAYLDIQLRLKNSIRYQTLFGYDTDVCLTLISLKESFLKRLFKSLIENGNFMETCPVHTGHYYLSAWNLNSALVPSYLFKGDYRIRGHGYYGKYNSKDEEFVINFEIDMIIS